ncbi:MAG: glycosyltransferase [Anaerolineae bacterium]|nr:glycosyltransferase [Anaerolineae bacterium]
MENTSLYLVQIIILGALGTVSLILLVNIFTVRHLETYFSSPVHFRVSVLIPTRNEQDNIERCVRSLLAQNYPDLEVIALDDHSTDQTWPILNRLAAAEERLKIMHGQSLPPGWMGKHWACHQLGQMATGDLLLFTDADVWFHPHALSNAVSALQTEQADLLAAIPREIAGSWAERLTVAILNFAMLLVYPYPLAARVSWPFMMIVNGQFMLFRRRAYDGIGGFTMVRKGVLDVQMGRRIKAFGYRWRLVNAGNWVFCRMYRNFGEVWSGFSKGLFPSFDYNLALFLLPLFGLTVFGLEPLAVRLLALWGYNFPGDILLLVDLSLLLTLLVSGLFHAWLKVPLYMALLYPLIVVLVIAIGLNSIYVAFTNSGSWKGRPYLPARKTD